MFNNMFENTRSSFDRLLRRLRLISNVISFSALAFFIAYYIYLIVISKDKTLYFVIYCSLLGVTLFMLIIDIIFLNRKTDNRLEKRRNKEKKRRISFVTKLIKITLKLVTIVVATYEIIAFGGSDLQIITLILSTMILIINIVFTLLIERIAKEIDLMRLSIEEDVKESKTLNIFFGKKIKGKEYSSKEIEMQEDIKERTKSYVDVHDKKKKGLLSKFKK